MLQQRCVYRAWLFRNCSFPRAVTSGLLLVIQREEQESSLGLTLFCRTGRYNPLICSLWRQNCKATFLGMERRALEEGHAFKIGFLSSFPSGRDVVLAPDQSLGIPALCLAHSSWLGSHHSPPVWFWQDQFYKLQGEIQPWCESEDGEGVCCSPRVTHSQPPRSHLPVPSAGPSLLLPTAHDSFQPVSHLT